METISIVYHDPIHLFLYFVLAHLIGDFLLQSEKLVNWKKKAKKGILVHVLIHFLVTSVLIAPYIYMSGGDSMRDPILMFASVLFITTLHFLIDMQKIKYEKKYPKKSLDLYIFDQSLHISVIILATLLFQKFASAQFPIELFGDIYFAKDIAIYAICMILVTYTWEITAFEIERSKKGKEEFQPNAKRMMIRGIIVSAIFILLTPLTAYAVNPKYSNSIAPNARIDDVEPNTFSFGDEVTVTGNGFGDIMDQYSQVCWGQVCVNRDSITKWTDTEIKFTMNVLGMPSQGLLHVIRLNSSGLYTEDVSGESVLVLPTIDKIYDEQGNRVFSLTAGQTVTVTGYYLGNTTGVIKMDNTFVTQIQPWTNSQVTFIVPALPNKTTTLFFQRRNSVSTTLNIPGQTGLSSDEFSHLQTYLFNSNVDKTWKEYDKRGEGITVAILDDGVDLDHPDLVHAIWQNTGEISGDGIDNDNNGYIDDINGYNFKNNTADMKPKGDHGTLVAGVIAAKANNNIGIAGIAPNTKIMPLIVCGQTNCGGQAVYDAVRYAVDNGADIINMSLTGFGDNPIFDPAYNEIMEYAHDNGVLVVVAAGNGNQSLSLAQTYYGRNFDENPISPVCNDGDGNWVIGIASINSQFSNSVFSDYGSNCIDVSAYGEAAYSTSVAEFSANGGRYGYAYGTSFATPQVSGALALAMSQFPSKTNEELKTALISSGFDLESNLALEFKGHFAKGLNIIAFMDTLAGKEAASIVRKIEDPDGNTAGSGSNDRSADILPGKGRTRDRLPNEGTVIPVIDENTGRVETPESVEIPDRVDSGLTTNFTDLGSTHPSYKAITYLSSRGVLEGYSDGSFKPGNTVNRAELLKILIAGQGINPDANRYRNCFADVAEEWFARYVCYAKAKGWIEGYSDGNFRPSQTVNKVEALKMMIESYKIELGEDESSFLDVKDEEWFAKYVAKAHKLGLLEERGALFNPSKGRTRSSISENIFRILVIQGSGAVRYEASLGEAFVE